MSTYLDTEMIKRLRNKTINELKRENEKQRVIIKKLKISVNKIAIEKNKKIVDKKRLKNIILKNNDNIEIVHFIGGG